MESDSDAKFPIHSTMGNSESRPLFHEELSFQIRGILMKVHGDVGPGFREESYQAAVKKGLTQRNISFVAKPHTERPLIYKGKEIAKLQPDFDIEGKIILELKAKRNGLAGEDFAQTLNYVKYWGCRLGLLANMGQNEVIIKSLPFTTRDPEVEENYDAFEPPLKPRLRALMKECRQALLNINNEVGVGYTDTFYRDMMLVELKLMNLKHEAEVNVHPTFMNEPLPYSPITPILVERKALIEVKAIHDHISATDRSVMQSHLHAAGAEVGLIVCFTKERLLLRGILP